MLNLQEYQEIFSALQQNQSSIYDRTYDNIVYWEEEDDDEE